MAQCEHSVKTIINEFQTRAKKKKKIAKWYLLCARHWAKLYIHEFVIFKPMTIRQAAIFCVLNEGREESASQTEGWPCHHPRVRELLEK